MIRLFVIVFSLAFLVSCSRPVINVIPVKYNSEVSAKQGIYYALPRNFIKIEITVDKTELIKGPYAEFAGKYLGLSNVITNNSTSYEISSYRISTYSEPDPSQFYFVEPDKSLSDKKHSLQMALSASGMILSTLPYMDTIPYEPVSYMADEVVNEYPEIFKYYADMNLFEKVDTIFEKVNVDSVTIEKMILKRSLVEKTPEQKARDAADFIIKVKENRFNLISGFQEVNYDKETFAYMNEELEKMENEYRKLFTGISFTSKIRYEFIYLPFAGKYSDSVALFKFSRLKGVLDTENIFGETFYLKIKSAGNLDSLRQYNQLKMNEKNKYNGYYYRLPDYADVSLLFGGKEMINGRFLIAQYGVVISLPPDIIDINTYPFTAALKHLQFGKP